MTIATVLLLPADSPWWLVAAADLILFLHIAGGAVALVSGAFALFTRKGGHIHTIAGLSFCVSIAVMASIGAATSPFLPTPERANVIAGILTLYLVWSGWAAVRSKHIVAGRLKIAGLFVALTTVATGVLWAVQASHSPTGTLDKTPPQAFYVFIIIGTFATIGDLRLIVKGRLSGAPRLTRHLWRMCVALLIASGSFFLGQQRVMPVWMRGSPLLFVPTLTPLLVLIYWLVRIRFKNRLVPREPHPIGASVLRRDAHRQPRDTYG
ncbi:MAG: hypothetical protein ABI939_12080 [Anaerolineaceae bacterium]